MQEKEPLTINVINPKTIAAGTPEDLQDLLYPQNGVTYGG